MLRCKSCQIMRWIVQNANGSAHFCAPKREDFLIIYKPIPNWFVFTGRISKCKMPLAGYNRFRLVREVKKQMSSRNRVNVPESRTALDNMKFEVAQQLGVNLKQGYNGNLTSRENGYVGGYMVKKMIEDYENSHK